MMKKYQIGHEYKDILSTSIEQDQFVSWFSYGESGIGNSGGVRPAKYLNIDTSIPAYIVLFTRNISHRWYNPWEDIIDFQTATIFYWGDAKFNKEKSYSDFQGNRKLGQLYDLILENELNIVPPILHFSKPKRGVVKFNGLCVLKDIDLTYFEDNGNPVKNYRCELDILDCEEVDVAWLHERVECDDISRLNKNAPKVWQDYTSGNTNKLDFWGKDISTKEEQLPPENSSETKLLEELRELASDEFEDVVVELLRNLPHVNHKIAKTRAVGDGGFDFYGQFSIPHPIKYEIEFLGEVKKYARSTAVRPNHVSRLVARLNRGQFGIFVTTSYYTRQTQEEVLNDGYPVKLLCGNDLVNILKELRLVEGSSIKKDWLESVFNS